MGYVPRSRSQLSPLLEGLCDQGILAIEDIYSIADLAALNSAMDPIFAQKSNEPRSYVRADEMWDAGIFARVLSPKMRALIFSLVPNAVLYHFHAYEIAGNATKSHIFSEFLSGWHRDPDSEFIPGDPTHISLFVYLKDVGEQDGPFEFSPHTPDTPLTPDSPAISMTGPAGMSFAWQRRYYHRASPNRGPNRRRLLKISIQPNEFPSTHLQNEFFAKTCNRIPSGDDELSLLFGKFQGKNSPRIPVNSNLKYAGLHPTKKITASLEAFNRLRNKEAGEIGKPVAYD